MGQPGVLCEVKVVKICRVIISPDGSMLGIYFTFCLNIFGNAFIVYTVWLTAMKFGTVRGIGA